MIVVQQTQRKQTVIKIKVVRGMKLDNVIKKTFVCVDGVVDQVDLFI